MSAFPSPLENDVTTHGALRYLPYSDDVEAIPPDEDRTVGEIVASLAPVGQALAHGYQHAVSAMSSFRLGRPPAVGRRKVPEV